MPLFLRPYAPLAFCLAFTLFCILVEHTSLRAKAAAPSKDVLEDGLYLFLNSVLFWALVSYPLSYLFAHLFHGGFRPVRTTLGAIVWLKAAGALLLLDLWHYWVHRAHHRHARLWRFHAIHHEPNDLHWLSFARFHPLNHFFLNLPVPLLFLLRLPEGVTGWVLLVSPVVSQLAHVNVKWSFGPLDFLITSPAVHRWHHSVDAEGQGKNFAAVFTFWDVLFGTFYRPSRTPPEVFGIAGHRKEKFTRQLLAPMRELASEGDVDRRQKSRVPANQYQ